jgi:hypothetical protein
LCSYVSAKSGVRCQVCAPSHLEPMACME